MLLENLKINIIPKQANLNQLLTCNERLGLSVWKLFSWQGTDHINIHIETPQFKSVSFGLFLNIFSYSTHILLEYSPIQPSFTFINCGF